jgi:hypothetical protein
MNRAETRALMRLAGRKRAEGKRGRRAPVRLGGHGDLMRVEEIVRAATPVRQEPGGARLLVPADLAQGRRTKSGIILPDAAPEPQAARPKKKRRKK